MARIIEVWSNIYINPDHVVSIEADGVANSNVTLSSGKNIKVGLNASALAKKLSI